MIGKKRVITKIFIALGLVALSLFVAAKPIFGTASGPVNYCIMAKKLAPAQDYSEFCDNSGLVSLSLGEKVRFAMRVGIENEVIDELKYRVFFPLDLSPTSITASVQPDALPQQALKVNLDLPAGTYLKYIPNTTVYETALGGGQYNDMEIPDVNGVSPLYANAGNWDTISYAGDPDEFVWTFMYFDMEVTAGDNPPEVPDPALELKTSIANLSQGEGLDSELSATDAISGDTVRVKVWLHNAQLDSLATGVVLAVALPGAGPAPSFSIASNLSSNEQLDLVAGAVVNSAGGDLFLNYVPGSAKLFHYGDGEGTPLTDAQAAALFGDGLSMGDAGTVVGCWIYQQWVEFDVTTSSILGGEEDIPKVLAATGPEHVLATGLLLGYLGFLVRKLKLTKYL
jgi:hypothetical protein